MAINYIILQITSPRAYSITALTHARVYLSITITAPVTLCWGLWDGCSIWWYRRCSAAGVEFANQSPSSPYILCAAKGMCLGCQCLWLPCTTSTRKSTWKTSLDVSTTQMPNYRPNLLWSEMSVSFSREEQAHPTTASQGSRQGLWVCSYTFTFPASTQNTAAAPVWATRNKTFTSPKGKIILMRPQCQALLTDPLYILLAHHSFVVFPEKGEQVPLAEELQSLMVSSLTKESSFCLQMVCKRCWAHFSHPSKGPQVVQ